METALTRRVQVRVRGVVQAVGFRPFVYREAVRLSLSGFVRNTSGGVEIDAEGSEQAIEELLHAIRHGSPPIARVEQVEVSRVAPAGTLGFRVIDSSGTDELPALISPDVATCRDCLGEMRDPSDRRFGYPFTNCTNCGPRFTIVEAVPYDRARTTMSRFELCTACAREYRDPRARRYHAEPNACPVCGPEVRLLDRSGRCVAERAEALQRARRLLAAGRIVAVKALGGFHLACDATCESSVLLLRERKRRPHRPFAVMCRDLDVVRAYCEVSPAEASELAGPRAPILLLRRRGAPAGGRPRVSDAVAPGHGDLGVMLPYTPLHHLLLEPGAPACLVMTSGNRAEEPIVADNEDAVAILGGIADAFVVHDRPIHNRCDDSVARVSGEHLVLMRRSKGFAPLPLPLQRDVVPTLALGAMLSNAFALADARRCFLSQHIGDVENLETLSFLRESIRKLSRWLGLDAQLIAHDMHPDLLTTHLAHELGNGRRRVAVQHHHAHLVAATAAAGLEGEVQGLVLDGTGWGPDGTIWGGELLVGSASAVRRAGHFRQLPLPGGDAAIRRPIRMAIGSLHVLLPGSERLPLDIWRRLPVQEARTVCQMVDRSFNTPRTSSAGRLFDVVSSLLGVCDEASYEGQAAIELEQLAQSCGGEGRPGLSVQITERDGMLVFDSQPLLAGLVEGLLGGADRAELALGFHAALAEAMAEACRRVRQAGGPEIVALCGGVFQNRILTDMTGRALREAGLVPVLPGRIPVNDGGLALGQVLIANASDGGG